MLNKRKVISQKLTINYETCIMLSMNAKKMNLNNCAFKDLSKWEAHMTANIEGKLAKENREAALNF